MQLIRSGYYHNPHFAEFQIANGGDGAGVNNFDPARFNNVADGCVNYRVISERVAELFRHGGEPVHDKERLLRNFLAKANQVLDYEANNREDDTHRRFRELRVAFLTNEIDEETFKTSIQRVDKAFAKRCETSAVYSMYGQSARDVLGRFAVSKEISYEQCVDAIKDLADYSKKCLADINGYYTNKRSAKFVPFF